MKKTSDFLFEQLLDLKLVDPMQETEKMERKKQRKRLKREREREKSSAKGVAFAWGTICWISCVTKPGPQPMLRKNEMFCSKDLLKGHIKACGNINVAKQE